MLFPGNIPGAIVLFATEAISIDLVAMIIMVVLLDTRLVTPEDRLSGFDHSATIPVLALLILSAGLQTTGAVNLLGRYLIKIIGKSANRALFIILIVSGLLSAFIINMAVVVIFMPIVFRIAKFTRNSPGKFPMPLSFFAKVGGTCSVIDTSTNIRVSDLHANSTWVLAILFIFTSMFTSIISSHATTILEAPSGIGLVQQMGINPKLFL